MHTVVVKKYHTVIAVDSVRKKSNPDVFQFSPVDMWRALLSRLHTLEYNPRCSKGLGEVWYLNRYSGARTDEEVSTHQLSAEQGWRV
jgi:hypothetical protein